MIPVPTVSSLLDAGLGALGGKPFLSLPQPLADIGQATKGFMGEVKERTVEFGDPVKIFAVSMGGAVGSLVGHQFSPSTAGTGTDTGYYGQQAILGVPALALGKIVADFFGGSPIFRAAIIGTIANGIMQLPVLFTKDKSYNLTSFLVKEVVLVPLSLLLVKRPAA